MEPHKKRLKTTLLQLKSVLKKEKNYALVYKFVSIKIKAT